MNKAWHEKARRRFAAPFIGGDFDFITVDPMMLSHSAVACGYTVRQFYEDPRLGAHCNAYVQEMYDLLPITHWFTSLPWLGDLGVEFRYMDHIAPVPVAPVIDGPEDVDRLEVPDVADIKHGNTFRDLTTAYDHIRENVPGFFTPITFGAELLGGAAELCGVENFIMWTLVEKDAAHRLKGVYRETCINGADAIANNYCSATISTGAVLANNDIFDDGTIREFAGPNLRKFVKGALGRGAGPQVFYHLCGNHETDYKVIKEHALFTPFTVFHIGYKGKEPFPSGELKQEFGNICSIMGSVDTRLFVMNDPRAVYEQASRQVIEGRDARNGYVLGTACEVPPYSLPGNIHAMVRASKDHGSKGMW